LLACHSVMIGAAVLNPRPQSFLTQPQGDQCPGTDIYLNGSQSGVSYQLLRDNILVTALSGSGTTLHFGAQYLTGIYTIRAVSPSTTCDTLMSGSTTILPGPLAFNITPAGANCSPTVVGLSGSQLGVQYQLYRNGFAIGGLVTGTGSAITFGAQIEGNYLVIAQIAATLCNDTMPNHVVITSGPTAFAGNDTTICASSLLLLNGQVSGNSSVLWLTTGDGMFSNPAILNPVYSPGLTDISSGTVRLILKVTGSPTCMSVSVSDTMVVTITPLPIVDAGPNDTICFSQTAALNASALYISSMHWITLGDGSFNNSIVLNPNYTPGPQDKLNGHVQLRLTVHGSQACQGDTLSDYLTLYIEPLPIAMAGLDDTICENMSYRLSGSAQHQSSVTWTTMGDGNFDNPALPDATYTPGFTDRSIGSVRLVLSAYGLSQCSMESDLDTMKLTLNNLPLVNAGADSTICASQVYHVFATVQKYSTLAWTTSGDGSFNNIHVLNPVYIPGPLDILTTSVWLKLTAHGLLGCMAETAADSLLLMLSPMPVANAGADTLSCSNIPIPQHGSALHYMSVLWTTLGDGTFDNASWINPHYSPGTADILLGHVDLKMTVNGLQQCASLNNTDTVRISFKPLPSVTLSGTPTICQGSSAMVSMSLTGLGPWTVTYTDGVSNFTISNIPSSPYNLIVSPIISTTYTMLSVTDANCSVSHTGPSFTVTVSQQPDIFAMTSSGPGYCAGGNGVEIGLSGSQTGILYQLLLGGLATGQPLSGNGSPLSFGFKTIPGIYQLKAYHPQTTCEVVYNDSIIVVVFPAAIVDFSNDSACFAQPTQFHLSGPDINKIATWHWDFGDGNTVNFNTPVEPAHIYPTTGSYLVTLTVTDTNNCIKSFVHQVSVNELPVALFAHNAPMCVGLMVHFTNNSYTTGNNFLVKWHWEFGDGTDTTIFWPNSPDVSHSYSAANTYSVTLTITTNRGCSSQAIRTVEITPPPVANFNFTGTCEQEDVHFTDISQLNGGGTIVVWNWNFGDPLSGINNTSALQSPVHVFHATGNYEVRLIVMNAGGCVDTIKKFVTVHAGPKALFTYTTACLGSNTQFTDTSIPNAASNIEWQWDFGDGSPVSASQNPLHLFANAGIYTVKLTVKNSNFCSHDTTLNVSVIPLPAASFQTNAPQCHGALVTFTNTSTTSHGHIVKWVWDFGDGTGSTILFPAVPNVTHAFVGTASQHLVRLTIKTSDSCSSWVEHLIQSVPGPVAAFNHSAILCPGENVLFTDASLLNGGGPITSWQWNFNDPTSGSGNYSTLQNPLHAFTGPGTFNVKLVVSNGGNCKDSLTTPVIINPLPVSAFTFDTVCLGS
ncbi:MAG: PKD domain-containing protein, partial [Bacteroidota bacterium]